MNENTKIDEMSYEQALDQLNELISVLETGEKPLEETLVLYERGQTLYQRCLQLLEKAELKVQQLDQDGGLSDFEG
jgi:exodeoxyribonuclease VII small subunit